MNSRHVGDRDDDTDIDTDVDDTDTDTDVDDTDTDTDVDDTDTDDETDHDAADDDHGDGDDDDHLDDMIVLPWWQRPFNIAVIVVTAVLLAGMVGWMVGESGSGPEAGPVDVGFLQDMREHHDQAVEISFLYLSLDDTNPGLRTVARGIIFGQGIEIGRMVQLLRDFGEPGVNEGDTSMAWMGHPVPLGDMPGLASDAELDELGEASGSAANTQFVELMVRHHEGGIEMAAFAAANAKNDEVRTMAAAIADSQREEITELERLLARV